MTTDATSSGRVHLPYHQQIGAPSSTERLASALRTWLGQGLPGHGGQASRALAGCGGRPDAIGAAPELGADQPAELLGTMDAR